MLSVAFRPDGRRLVTTSADGTVRQWDSTTGREVEPPYDRHTGEVMTAEYSPDGLWIASGGTDRTVRVWGAANRQDVAVLHGHTGDVSELAFTADGRRLASASQSGRLGYTGDGTVRLWEVGRQAGASVLRGHTSYVYPVAYSPDGQWIASGSWDNTVRLWDAVTGGELRDPASSGVCARAGLQPGQLVVGLRDAIPDDSLQIWDVATARLQKKVQGARERCCSGNRGEPGRSPHRGCGRRRKREHHGSRDRRGSPFLSDGRASATRSRWPTVPTDDSWRVRVKTARKLISGTRKRTIDRPG